MTSNSSSASAANDSHSEDKSSRRHIESLSSKSPSHKRYESYIKDSKERTSGSSLDNAKSNGRLNNNHENDTNPTVPASPSTKSRIPVLRSASCRAVQQSSQPISNAKNTVPKSICFGHGIAKTFKMSQSNIKGCLLYTSPSPRDS